MSLSTSPAYRKNSIRSIEPSRDRTRQIGTFHAAGARKSAAAAMKKQRKRVILALEPGLYLVSADRRKTRVWKTDGMLVVGHGSKLRRSIVRKIFDKLMHAANRADAIVERKKRRHTAT
jgi:hypothetical protein